MLRTAPLPGALAERPPRARWIHCNVVHAVANLSIRVRNVFRLQSAIDRLPGLAGVIGTKGASRRNGNPYSFRIFGIKNDGMQAHSARARLPVGAGAVSAQPCHFL